MSAAHQELVMQVTKAATTPLGSSVAAAIITCIIYFLFLCAATYSFIITKYPWYDILMISIAFRVVCMGCRAAYLVHYTPALQGTFLAFANAGFAASTACIWVTCGAWILHNGRGPLFTVKGDKFARLLSYLACAPIIFFGPILGVIAAGLIYGAWRTAPHVAHIGGHIRAATSYGILFMTFFLLCWVCLLFAAVLLAGCRRKQKTGDKAEFSVAGPSKNPILIGIFIPAVLLLMVRATAGVVPIYGSKRFVWGDDTWFYLLDTLPEFLSLVILCWPKLLARISCAPRPPSKKDKDVESS